MRIGLLRALRRQARAAAVATLLTCVTAAAVIARPVSPLSRVWFARFDTLGTRVPPDSVGRWVVGPELGANADTTARAVAAVLRARQLLSGARYASSAAQAKAALAHAIATRDTLLECRARYELAMAHALSGDVAPAPAHARRALSLARAARLPREGAHARLALAYLDVLGERWPSAERGYRAALRGLSPRFDPTLCRVARVGLSRALFQQGRTREARALDVRIISEARASGDRVNEAYALNNLATHELLAGDPADAIPSWRRALALQRDGGRVQEAVTTATNLAGSLLWLGRDDEAASVLEEYADSTRTPMRMSQRAEVVSMLATVRARQRRDTQATQLAAWAWDLYAAARVAPSRQLVQTRATLATDRGDVPGAIALTDAWLRAHAAAPDGAANADAREDALVVRGVAATQLLRAKQWAPALERWHALVADMDTSTAREQVKYGYARLGEAIAHFGLGARADGRAATFAALAAWERGREGFRSPEWRELLERDGPRLWGEALTQLRLGPGGVREAFDVGQRLKARTFGERMRGGAAAPVTAAWLQRRVLAPGELAVDAYPCGESLLVFVLTRERLSAYTVPDREALEERVARFAALALDPGAASGVVENASQSLARELLGPEAAAFARATQVIVTGEGVTDALLWDLLAPPGAGRALGANSAVATVPSLSALARLRSRSANARRPGPVVLAGLTGPDGRALSGAREECDFLRQRYAGAEIRAPRSAAGVRAALGALRGAGVIHVAAHFAADPENPWRNGILLGPPGEDGSWLRPADLGGRTLDASLAVLAGCSSGAAGEFTMGGERGLASAFLAAGARSVVGTLGPVEDRASAGFVRALYAELERGGPAGVALARARAAVRTSWGADAAAGRAFVLLGDPRANVRLTRIRR